MKYSRLSLKEDFDNNFLYSEYDDPEDRVDKDEYLPQGGIGIFFIYCPQNEKDKYKKVLLEYAENYILDKCDFYIKAAQKIRQITRKNRL